MGGRGDTREVGEREDDVKTEEIARELTNWIERDPDSLNHGHKLKLRAAADRLFALQRVADAAVEYHGKAAWPSWPAWNTLRRALDAALRALEST